MSKVVDPAPVTIMAGHDRSGELIANMTDEDRRLSRLYRPVDIVIRVVPGPRQAAGAP